MTGRRLHLRAAFVAFHVLAIGVGSLPGTSLTTRARWKSEGTHADIVGWASRARAAGVDVTDEAFESRLYELAVGYARVRRTAGAPFDAYAGAVGAGQGWTMFASPQRFPAELHVDVMVGGAWRPLYRPRSDAHAWRRALFDHNRMRKFTGRFARGFDRRVYGETAAYLAHLAARDVPEATKVRVSLYRTESLPPERVRRGERPVGRTTEERVFDAAGLR
jgi:hypothetical protein